MPDDKKKKPAAPKEPSYIQKLLEKYSPFHIVGKKLEDAVKPPEKKPETEAERKERLTRQAMLGAGVQKKK